MTPWISNLEQLPDLPGQAATRISQTRCFNSAWIAGASCGIAWCDRATAILRWSLGGWHHVAAVFERENRLCRRRATTGSAPCGHPDDSHIGAEHAGRCFLSRRSTTCGCSTAQSIPKVRALSGEVAARSRRARRADHLEAETDAAIDWTSASTASAP
jgi:hypothetical protein